MMLGYESLGGPTRTPRNALNWLYYGGYCTPLWGGSNGPTMGTVKHGCTSVCKLTPKYKSHVIACLGMH